MDANKIKRIYWGDIHAHTLYSDGSGTPDEAYRYARDSALIDFAALTDHTEFTPMYGHIDLFHQFKRYQEISNSYNETGKFVVLLAAEYTPMLTNIRHYLATGHVNLYFKGEQMPYFSSLEEDNPEMLIEHIKNSTSEEFMGWSHHQIRGAQCYDFGYFIPSVMKMEEIFSCHGSSEFIDDRNLYPIVHELPTNEHGFSINDALKMGYRFGLMASSDTHDGRLGHSLVHTDARALNQYPFSISAYRYGVHYPGGLTAVYTYELNRDSIFDALYNRSAYAPTWVSRPFLNFSINGVCPGMNNSEVVVNIPTAPRVIRINAIADGISKKANTITNITRIEIIKNSDIWKQFEINDKFANLTIIDNKLIRGTSYTHCIQKEDGKWYINSLSMNPVDPSALNTHGFDYYYVRLLDTNYQAAWIGPIWVGSK